MNKGALLFLRIVIAAIALGALAICIFLLPSIAADDAARHPDLAWQQYPFLAYAYILCAAFFVALYQAFKLLNYIGANNAFSERSARALKIIKYCAILIGVMIAGGIATVMIMAAGKDEDITGIVMMGIILTLIASIGGTIVAVLQRHVQKAVELKSENDLTI